MQLRATPWMLIAITAAGLIAADPANSAKVMMEAAHKKEVVDGDLNGAIKAYAAIVAKYKTDRTVAAAALLRMAECHQKLGDAEARKIYEQILRDYADQKEAVSTARARLGRTQPVKTISFRQVWSATDAQVDGAGSVSSDGRYISFSDRDKGGELALHDIVTNTDRVIVPVQTGEHTGAGLISRDSGVMAYTRSKTGEPPEVCLVGLSGEPKPRRLFRGEGLKSIFLEDWSPDGKWIAVDAKPKTGDDQVGLLSTTDGSLRILKPLKGEIFWRAFFSPDGKFLAYANWLNDSFDRQSVYLLDVENGLETPVVQEPNQNMVVGWAPDGRLLFASDRGGSLGLWALSLRDGRRLGDPVLLRDEIGSFNSSLGLTDSGGLYLSRDGGAVNISVASIDWAAGKILSPPVNPAKSFIGSNASAFWSADGKSLGYVSLRGPTAGCIGSECTGRNVIASVSLESGQIYKDVVPPLGYDISSPAWTPDGHSFVFSGGDPNGETGVFRLDGPTGEVTPIVFSEKPGPGRTAFIRPQWSPNGRTIYYVAATRSKASPSVAYIARDQASGNQKEIIRRTNLLEAIRVSPDGKWIATSTVDPASQSATLLLVPADGGTPRELWRVNEPRLGVPGWAPDGRSVIVLRTPVPKPSGELHQDFWRVPIDGASPSKLDIEVASLHSLEEQFAGPFQISSDGHLAYTVAGGGPPAEVSVLENFLTAAGGKR